MTGLGNSDNENRIFYFCILLTSPGTREYFLCVASQVIFENIIKRVYICFIKFLKNG